MTSQTKFTSINTCRWMLQSTHCHPTDCAVESSPVSHGWTGWIFPFPPGPPCGRQSQSRRGLSLIQPPWVFPHHSWFLPNSQWHAQHQLLHLQRIFRHCSRWSHISDRDIRNASNFTKYLNEHKALLSFSSMAKVLNNFAWLFQFSVIYLSIFVLFNSLLTPFNVQFASYCQQLLTEQPLFLMQLNCSDVKEQHCGILTAIAAHIRLLLSSARTSQL